MLGRSALLAAICWPVLLAADLFGADLFGADLPVREVILYKHGVGFFERSGELKPGDTARLDFKAGDMNDVLKSLTITDRNGGKIGGVRYDASESLEKRLEDFPFALGQQASLVTFLDQLKGAQLEIKIGSETISGTIAGARLAELSDKGQPVQHETVTLLTAAGELRTIDLGAATSVKLPDPKQQALLKDYLGVLNNARSKDRRSVYIDSVGAAARELVASYMTPAAVWKSSYRLLFTGAAEPTLEGWAIVDNTSGEDWDNVKLSVVSGRPISFISQLYPPRYVQRPTAELAEDRAVGPQVFQGGVSTGALAGGPPPPAAPAARAFAQGQQGAQGGGGGGRGGGIGAGRASANEAFTVTGSVSAGLDAIEQSAFSSVASGQDVGELFEYSFSSPVTVKMGESAMLPFLQQKVGARKLLIYSENMGLHPMNAAEVSNSTSKTLDGGPITVYDAGAYAGEALVETLKAGDKRLISYGVDLGMRISTKWDSSSSAVREIHLHRGILTTRNAVQETKTFTIKNVDAQAKTLVIEHPERSGYKLLNQTPSEKTSNAYRFEVKVAASAEQNFPVAEERINDQSISLNSASPDVFATWIQNKALSDGGRRQLEQIAQKKSDVAANDAALAQVQADRTALTQDEARVRENISSLRQVSGQQDQVQQYARQLAEAETKLAALRDSESDLRKKKTQLQAELNTLIDKADF
jgi:hypothetical protein